MKLTQNQYTGLLKDMPSRMEPGSQFVSTDTDELYLYGDDMTPVKQQQEPLSPLKNVSDGNPNVDESEDAYRTGKVGLGEPNPQELLDVVSQDSTGGVKTQHTYDDGSVFRAQLGGNRLLEEYGVPAASRTTGWYIDYFNHPSYSNYRAFTYMGDISGSGLSTLTGGFGIAPLTGDNYARLVIEPVVNNTPLNGFRMRMQCTNIDGDFGEVCTRPYGVGAVGHSGEMQMQYNVSNSESDRTDIYQSPHEFVFLGGPLRLHDYRDSAGANKVVEGFVNTDDVARTGSAASVIGEATAVAGIDDNGFLLRADSVNLTGLKMTPTTEPVSPVAGQVYYDSTSNKLRCYNGTIWNDLF